MFEPLVLPRSYGLRVAELPEVKSEPPPFASAVGDVISKSIIAWH